VFFVAAFAVVVAGVFVFAFFLSTRDFSLLGRYITSSTPTICNSEHTPGSDTQRGSHNGPREVISDDGELDHQH
jgi:hypothetical protein